MTDRSYAGGHEPPRRDRRAVGRYRLRGVRERWARLRLRGADGQRRLRHRRDPSRSSVARTSARRRCSSSTASPSSRAASRRPGKGARILLKDEAANPSGSFKVRRAALAVHEAKRLGFEGVIAATSGNYGAAVASQAAQQGLGCIVLQEVFDSSWSRPAGDPREGACLRGVRSRGVAADGRPGALLRDAAPARGDRVLQRLALHPARRRRDRDAWLGDRPAGAGALRAGSGRRRRHARRGRKRHRHGAWPPEGRVRRHRADRGERGPARAPDGLGRRTSTGSRSRPGTRASASRSSSIPTGPTSRATPRARCAISTGT